MGFHTAYLDPADGFVINKGFPNRIGPTKHSSQPAHLDL